MAGADIVFLATHADTGQRRAVLVQAKSGAASLRTAVPSATPAWQFVTEAQRASRLRGVAVLDWSAKRSSFAALAETAQPGLFDNAIRVLFSAAGFQPAAVRTCNLLNRSAAAHSPLVLLVATASDLGDVAVAICNAAGSRAIGNTANVNALLPLSVRAVTAAGALDLNAEVEIARAAEAAE